MKMTYVDALDIAIAALSAFDEQDEKTEKAVEKLVSLRTTYKNRNENRVTMSDEKKAELSAKRKAETAKKRADLMAVVLPVIRGALTDENQTAKDIFTATENLLPKDFTDKKVQYVLLHELADEVEVIKIKGEPNYYKKKA